jgi:3-dehydroshikimate dehydratase
MKPGVGYMLSTGGQMIRSGLVSVTFRKLTSRSIIDLVTRADLAGIEWGGDIHVPHGGTRVAQEVAQMTRDADLFVAAYGSYYRAGVSEADGLAFERVLETAVALGAPTVRVWAGNRGSADADGACRSAVVEDARRIAVLAHAAGITVSFEYHRDTLTDTNTSAHRLLEEVGHPNVRVYWQPPIGMSSVECLQGLDAVSDYLSNAHVFQWTATTPTAVADRRPLAEGAGVWPQYLERIAATDRDHFALLEFVRGDEPEQFLADGRALNTWLTELGGR